MGFPEKFATSALRLANNNLDQAAVLVQNMTARASDLEKGVVESVSSSSTPPTLTTSTSSMSLSLSYNATGPAVMASQSKLHKSHSLDASFESDTLISDALDPVLSPRGDENKREVVVSYTVSTVCVTAFLPLSVVVIIILASTVRRIICIQLFPFPRYVIL
jgi:hypothetical protein